MNKLKRIFGWALLLPCMALCAQAARAQGVATVLSSFTDLANDTLFAEVSVSAKACRTYSMSFTVRNQSKNIGPVKVKIVKVQQLNVGTVPDPSFKLDINGDSISGMTLGGYTLAFPLDKSNNSGGLDIAPGDSLILTAHPKAMALVCENCGINNETNGRGSVMVFADTSDIEPGCPFDDNFNQLVYCRRRPAPAKNWEAFIRDDRTGDCQFYRVVQMPDDRWWFAENLVYRSSDLGEEILNSVSIEDSAKYFRANGSYNFDINMHLGVMYRRPTFMRINGSGELTPDVPVNTTDGSKYWSTSRGICPQGWLIPGDYDWAVLLDSVEGSSGNHNEYNPSLEYSDSSRRWLGYIAGKQLRSIHMCSTNPSSSCYSTSANNQYLYWKYDSGSPRRRSGGVDTWGFSVLPGGFRDNRGGGYLDEMTEHTVFASATIGTTGTTIIREFRYNENGVRRGVLNSSKDGVYVRCVKDGK
jgi:uncharacterized protein (TIGR02145 family)